MFLTFSCIGYAMPFILCATICCCLPCIISILGFREDFSHTRGAAPESINALPTYKFKLKNGNVDDREVNSGAGEGGVLAAGTEKERAISGEDAVSSIISSMGPGFNLKIVTGTETETKLGLNSIKLCVHKFEKSVKKKRP